MFSAVTLLFDPISILLIGPYAYEFKDARLFFHLVPYIELLPCHCLPFLQSAHQSYLLKDMFYSWDILSWEHLS